MRSIVFGLHLHFSWSRAHAYSSRLPGAVGAEETEDLTALHLEAEAIHDH